MRQPLPSIAVVTGASSGMGRALALALARPGASLALCDVSTEALEEVAEEVRHLGADVLAVRVDVAEREEVFAFAEATLARYGRVELVVNNAGVALSQTVEGMSWEDMRWIVDINFWGVVYGTKAFLPSMLARGAGHVVNVSSVFGLIGTPTQSAYNATKFAVRGFTEALRQEVEGTGVRVSCVHPGGIRTNIARNSRFYVAPGGSTDAERSHQMFARLARTTPEQAARTILDGVARGRDRILVGADAHVIDAVQRVFPVRYDRMVAAALRQAAPAEPRGKGLVGAAMRGVGAATWATVRAAAAAGERLPWHGPHVVEGRTLDPQVRVTLSAIHALGLEGSDDDTPERARRRYVAEVGSLPFPRPAMEAVHDVTVRGGAGPIRARVYVPRGLEPSAPVLMWMHGGGFVIGGVRTHDPITRALADAARCVVVSLDYRLAPEHRFPAAYEDCVAAFSDLRARVGEWGGDRDRIAVGGDSAGGNLAAAVAQAAARGELEGAPVAQLLAYAAVDMTGNVPSRKTFSRGYLLESSRIQWFTGNYIQPGELRDVRASPLFAASVVGVCPAIIHSAGFDPLVDDSVLYTDRLREAGVPVVHRLHEGLVHGYLHFAGAWDGAREAFGVMAEDLRRAFAVG